MASEAEPLGAYYVSDDLAKALMLTLSRSPKGSMTLRELTQALSCPPSSVSRVVSTLMSRDHMVESGEKVARGAGRPSRPVQLSRQQLLVGIYLNDSRDEVRDPLHHPGDDAAVSRLFAVLTNLHGKVLASTPGVPVSRAELNDPSGERMALLVRDVVRSLLDKSQTVASNLRALCLTFGGVLDGGVVATSCNLPWATSVQLEQALHYEFPGVTIRTINDANALMVERTVRPTEETNWGGDYQPSSNFLLVLVHEDGIGGALWANGQQVVGHRGGAGEIGHFKVRNGGRHCRCGQRGCLEAFAAPANVMRRSRLKELAQAALTDGGSEERGVSTRKLIANFGAAGEAVGREISKVCAWCDPEVALIYLPSELFHAPDETAAGQYREKLRAAIADTYPSAPGVLFLELTDRQMTIAQAASASAYEGLVAALAAK